MSAAMRARMSVRSSMWQRSTESIVMAAIVSSTGVADSVAMAGPPFDSVELNRPPLSAGSGGCDSGAGRSDSDFLDRGHVRGGEQKGHGHIRGVGRSFHPPGQQTSLGE